MPGSSGRKVELLPSGVIANLFREFPATFQLFFLAFCRPASINKAKRALTKLPPSLDFAAIKGRKEASHN